MQYKTHKLGGMCAGAITSAAILGSPYVGQNFNEAILPATLVLITAGAIGSSIPDIDHPNSHISKRNPILSALTQMFLSMSKFFTTVILALCFWISKKRKQEILSGMEHRGIFHTILMTFIIYYTFGFFAQFIPVYGKYIQIGITVGYLSHILVDMLTKSGVMLLYPVITKKFHWPFIRLSTGKHEGVAVCIILCITMVSILFTLGF